jgi:PAS domain S-box-containing protein
MSEQAQFPDDPARLAALRALRLLDTGREERFDRITRLATLIFGVPIAAISLIDDKRQWIKSHQGLKNIEVPREDGLCAHAILEPGRTLVVQDTLADERFRDKPAVTGEENIRFYAGEPLLSPDGHVVGAFYICDHESRMFAEENAVALRDLARMAEAELTATELNTALERLQTAEENYRGIFENIAEGIFQIDPDGHFRNANPAVARVYGYESPAEFIDQVRDFGRARQVEPFQRSKMLLELEEFGRVKDAESEIFRRDGTTAWICESIHAVADAAGARLYYEGTVHDITAHRYAAAAQAQARDEALRSAQVKSDFLSMMSHEIRTPMHGIIGMTGLLLNTELKPEQEELVRLIASCGDNLLGLINNALDFSKIEAGCLELDNQPFSLRPCLKEVIDLLSVQAAARGVKLGCEVDPRIPEVLVSDVTRVRQILFNLISNSVKFTPSGGTVDVVVTGHQLDEKVENHGHAGAIDPWLFHVTVRDTGEGIPEEKLHRLFRPFSQVDASVSRKHGGTGLGLAICHRLCEMLGGAIWLESEPGVGSNFEFTIKAAAVPNAVPIAKATPEPPPAAGAGALESPALLPRLNGAGDLGHSARKPGTEQKNGAPEANGKHEANGAPVDRLAAAVAGDPAVADDSRRLLSDRPLGAPAAPADACAAGATRLTKLEILLVEDNPVNQRVAMGLLKQIGCTAHSTNNGLEALIALEAKTYEVILMDIQMPEMDGLEASREIRRRWPDGPRRPYIIAMTANAMAGDREKCLDAGMDDYITKPVKAIRLKTALEQCCELRAAIAAVATLPARNGAHSEVQPAELNRDSLEALKSLQSEGDNGFLKEMIDLFLADTPSRFADMDAALTLGQQQEFVRAVHSIKGASANFGADDLHHMCAEIEQIGRAGRMTETAAQIQSLHQEFERVRVALLAEVA